MSFAITTGAVGLIGAGAQIYQGINQRNKAKRIRDTAVDPGISRNYALDRVTNTLFQNYSNWNLPGYNNYVNQVGTNMASANNLAVVGATSSADILNSVTASQEVADRSLADLALQSASGRERALMQYLQASSNQWQDQVRVNQMELERYNAKLREAGALEGAGIQNTWGGFQDALMTTGAVASNFLPRQTVDQSTGDIIKLDSAWDAYRKRKSGNVYGPNSAQLTYNGLQA